MIPGINNLGNFVFFLTFHEFLHTETCHRTFFYIAKVSNLGMQGDRRYNILTDEGNRRDNGYMRTLDVLFRELGREIYILQKSNDITVSLFRTTSRDSYQHASANPLP